MRHGLPALGQRARLLSRAAPVLFHDIHLTSVMPSDPVTLQARGLARTFVTEHGPVAALAARDLDARPGEAVALMGRSGCGKSTLLNLLGLLELPSAGQLSMLGVDVLALDARERARFRLAHLGFVFQNFCLLKDRSLVDNVELPLVYAGHAPAERRRRVDDWLTRVGLDALRHRRPGELSGGQQQRAAIARAMALEPRIVLADEPTGSLDAATGAIVFDDLLTFCRAARATCIVATHDPLLAQRCHRVLRLDETTEPGLAAQSPIDPIPRPALTDARS
jgi:ABC-type lipoprotein export system ATPase subunit